MLGRAPVGLVRMSDGLAPRSSSPGCRPTGAAGSPRRSRRSTEVEAIIGVDNEEPTRRARAHRVRAGRRPSTRLLRRIVEAAEIDTVVDTRLVVDSTTTSPAKAHENNVIGTMNILAACSRRRTRRCARSSSSPRPTSTAASRTTRPSSTEAMRRPHPPRTPIERDIVEAEASLDDFAEKNPDVTVTLLRFANVLGPDVAPRTSGCSRCPPCR